MRRPYSTMIHDQLCCNKSPFSGGRSAVIHNGNIASYSDYLFSAVEARAVVSMICMARHSSTLARM